MPHQPLSRVFFIVVVAQLMIGSEANQPPSEDPLAPDPLVLLNFHIPAPVLVDPLLCQQLKKGYETKKATEAVRVAQLLDLCAGKVNESSSAFPESPVERRLKRGARGVKSLLTKEHQKMMLDMHNDYRRRVKPQAADMKFMKWDEYLADTAQMWSDECDFVHGFPNELLEKNETIGQNLYLGMDSTGFRAMTMWFDEYEFYEFESGDCESGEQCGHYVQLIWAESEYLGCGVTKCIDKGFLITCHYKPAGNALDVAPYLVGKPCSQCPSKRDGGLCYKKACVTKTECGDLTLNCSCDLECHNCATLNKKFCRCVCKKGWDSLDCSKPCADNHLLCNSNPGWPDSFSCPLSEGKVRNLYCRKMCKQCAVVDPKGVKDSKDYCCGGEVCDVGSVLNADCDCDVLCPGPDCLDHESMENIDDIHNIYEISTRSNDEFSHYMEGGKEQEEREGQGTETVPDKEHEDKQAQDEAPETPKIATKIGSSSSTSLDSFYVWLLPVITLVKQNA